MRTNQNLVYFKRPEQLCPAEIAKWTKNYALSHPRPNNESHINEGHILNSLFSAQQTEFTLG